MADKETIEHEGVITRIEGNTAYVAIQQTTACAGCHVKKMCNASDTAEKMIEAAMFSPEFEVGETVKVVGRKSIAFQAVLLAYVLPFCLVLGALILFNSFIDSEALTGTLALCVLVPYLLVLRAMHKRLQAKFSFYVTKIS